MGIADDIKDGLIGGAVGFVTGGPAGAIAGAASGLLGGSEAGAAEDAGEIQLQASREAIEEQRRAEEQLRRDLAPYSGFGFGALGPLSTAIGITPQNTFSPLAQQPVQQPQGLSYTAEGNTATLNQPAAALQGFASGGQVAQPAPQQPLQIVPGDQWTMAHTRRAQGAEGISPEDQMRLASIAEIQSKLDSDETFKSPDREQNRRNQIQQLLNELSPELRQTQLPETNLSRLQNQYDELLGREPEIFGGQQQQGAQQPLTAQPSAFNSRADTLLGTSETNPLLQQAIEMRQDGSQILQNPLLQQMQADVTRRVMANQAARGKLGSGSTLSSLQNQLIPQALAFREQEISGLTGLGTTAEDLRQREIGNLFQAAGIGANAAARTGQAGITAAGNIGSLQTYGGEAQALAGLGAAQSRQNQIGQFIGGIAPMLGGGRPFNSFGNMARGGGLQQAGPPLPTGGF